MLFEDVETTRPGGPAMTKAGGRLVLVAVALLAASLPSWAQSHGGPAVAMDGAWHFTIAPYAWFSGISGKQLAGGHPEGREPRTQDRDRGADCERRAAAFLAACLREVDAGRGREGAPGSAQAQHVREGEGRSRPDRGEACLSSVRRPTGGRGGH